jgi:hypothetical protein
MTPRCHRRETTPRREPVRIPEKVPHRPQPVRQPVPRPAPTKPQPVKPAGHGEPRTE